MEQMTNVEFIQQQLNTEVERHQNTYRNRSNEIRNCEFTNLEYRQSQAVISYLRDLLNNLNNQ